MQIDITITTGDNGIYHLIAKSFGESKDECLAGVELVFDRFSRGKETYIRAMPEANSETDFDTKITRHMGYVRFSFLDRPGTHHMQNAMCGVGLIPIA